MANSILTPDQRVRVFISSTIGELADERLAARDAINSLHLIPVFFEMGARPHPPRDLYRAYLEQSHIFIGIYWKSYGWVAPGMDISGLEDEYRLSASKPQLIYIKNTIESRDPGLSRLLKELEQASTACYQKFTTAEELKGLIASDLSLLLSEHFRKKAEDTTPPIQKKTALPHNASPLIGRESDLAAIIEILNKPEVKLVTITGSGGTGKSRISLQIANEIKNQYRDGVFFVPLAAVHQPQSFVPALAENLGIFDSGKQSLEETITNFLFDKNALLLIDNFEQIVEAATYLSELIQHCKDIKILVTSRSPLHLRDEYLYPLAPLGAPSQSDLLQLTMLMDFPSIELFIRRSQEINPSLKFDRENLLAVAQICHKLDGIPLAIELAAARTKLISPSALLQRMESTLDTLTKGAQDLPDRHKTLRAAIDWSYQLLDEPSKQIFNRLSIFNGGWTLEAAEEVVNWEGLDILAMLEKLMDLALIQANPRKYDTFFSMFETVREFATELLSKHQDQELLSRKHSDYYIRFLEEAKPYLWMPQREIWLVKIDAEYNNIREAFAHVIGNHDRASAWRIVQALGFYWAAYGKITEANKWIDEAGISSDEDSLSIRTQIDPLVQAAAFRTAGMIHFFTSNFRSAVKDLKESTRIFSELGEELEAGRSMAYLGIARISTGDYEAAVDFSHALEIGKKYNDAHSFIMASTFMSEVLAGSGKLIDATILIDESVRLAKSKDDHMLCLLALGQRGNIELIKGDYNGAAKYYHESLSYEKRARVGSLTGWFQLGLGVCMLVTEEYPEAKKYLEIALNTARNVGDKAILLSVFIGFAFLAIKNKNIVKVAQLYGAAENLIQQSGYRMWNESKRMNDFVIKELSLPANSELAETERRKGFSLSVEEAIELALSV